MAVLTTIPLPRFVGEICIQIVVWFVQVVAMWTSNDYQVEKRRGEKTKLSWKVVLEWFEVSLDVLEESLWTA